MSDFRLLLARCAAACLLLGLSTVSHALNVGCDWLPQPWDTETSNNGYLDSHASYYLALLPSSPGPDTEIIIEGTYPQVRYFSFQVSSGYSFSNLVDQISDAKIYPEEGGSPNPNPAALPPSNGYTNHYRLTIKFIDPPAEREPNTLYAGARTGALPQITFRRYLANPGVSVEDPADLPTLTYVGPKGTIPLSQTPEQSACKALNNYFKLVLGTGVIVNPVVYPSPTPVFTPIFFIKLIPYPNADSPYLEALTSQVSDMVVVRVKLPVTPVLPPGTNTPEARYWSICQNERFSTANVACIADSEAVAQADGYSMFVISPDAKRPPLATTDNGYNWMPWGSSYNAYVAMRETLPAPDFPGSYSIANQYWWKPMSQTIPGYEPESTYCDLATFNANAAIGGETLIQACRAAYVGQAARNSSKTPAALARH